HVIATPSLLPPASYFFLHQTPTPQISTLSLQRRSSDLARCRRVGGRLGGPRAAAAGVGPRSAAAGHRLAGGPHGGAVGEGRAGRSEEHTSELQSRSDLVCRLLLEKKKSIRAQRPSLRAS